MWLAFTNCPNCCQRMKEMKRKTERKGCWAMCFELCCSLFQTHLSSAMVEKRHLSKTCCKAHVSHPPAFPLPPITHRVARGTPRAGRVLMSPFVFGRSTGLREHFLVSEKIRSEAPGPQLRLVFLFPWQFRTVCVLVGGSLCPCIHTWNPKYEKRAMELWDIRRPLFMCVSVWLIFVLTVSSNHKCRFGLI